MKKNNSKTVLIIGYGQDGKILEQIAVNNGSKVIVITNKIKKNENSKKTLFYNFDISEKKNVFNFLKKLNKVEIYFLATHNISSSQKEKLNIFKKNLLTNVEGLSNFLEYMSLNKYKKFKLFYACSSHIFENTGTTMQNEKTKPVFNSNYGFVKYLGLQICNNFRERNNIFCCSGILYTHVSKYVNNNFLIKELARKVKNTKKNIIYVKNSEAKTDIMAANDAVEAMISIMKLKKPENFIISSGKQTSIQNIFHEIKKYYGVTKNIKIKSIKKNNKSSTNLLGNNTKLLKKTSWIRKINLKQMINEVLVNE